MAKAKAAPPPPPIDDEDDAPDCPKCPPVGAPAWMSTFADMATLLMAFFVLLLAFANFNEPSFQKMAGSMKDAFGVQRLIPNNEQPEGMTVIEMNFSPSPTQSLVNDMTQQTTKRDMDEVDVTESHNETENDNPENPDAKQGQAEGESQGGAQGENGEGKPGEADQQGSQQQSDQQQSDQQSMDQSAQDQFMNMIQDALESGNLSVATDGDQVIVKMPPAQTSEEAQQMAQAMQQASGSQGANQQQAAKSDQTGSNGDQTGNPSDTTGNPSEGDGAEGAGTTGGNGGAGERRASIADAKLQVALQEQIDQGLVTVERREDKVFVTVGSGGAFQSGSADMTAEAQEIIDRLSLAGTSNVTNITVTGHTDDVPLTGGQFQDNWGLAAGRASSVVRAIGDSGLIDPSQLTAISKGESDPVADNSTAEGREQNRRIEIEITYDDQ